MSQSSANRNANCSTVSFRKKFSSDVEVLYGDTDSLFIKNPTTQQVQNVIDWAKKEKLKSFAAYPLIYKGKSIAVLAIFSKKKQSHVDFEILGIFCDQLSKELAGLFEAKDFLSE